METKRSTTAAAEEILGLYFPVLNHGFISLVDYMGGDADIDRAARTSYGATGKARLLAEIRTLIRYLRRHKHTTPTEMVELKFHCAMPMFIARQWIRHRTACLTGNTMLHFDLPGGIRRRGNQKCQISIADIYRKFQPTCAVVRPDRQKNAFFKRDRIQQMMLRCVNEDTQAVQHTSIVDIWESGVKPVFRVTTEFGATAEMSKDHLCLTDKGWLRLQDFVELPTDDDPNWTASGSLLAISPGRNTGVVPQFNPINPTTEAWEAVVEWEGFYEVSDQGRVRRIIGGKGTSAGKIKKRTVSNGHACVSMNRPGEQVVKLIHALMLEAFVGPCPEDMEGCHSDGNGLNNILSNLRWDTPKSNADDRIRDGATTALIAHTQKITEIVYLGERQTYDLEVEGPHHNFSAGGLVVHNSVNEWSGRYSKLKMLFYTPDAGVTGTQSKTNKQGRGNVVPPEMHEEMVARWEAQRTIAADNYDWMTESDVALELARIDLPLSTYTSWYWKIDLHNLLHFLTLRADSHAQHEIQVFARIMAGMVKRVAPASYEAWIDYDVCGARMSRMEMEIIRSLIGFTRDGGLRGVDSAITADEIADQGLGAREREEFLAKFLNKLTPDFELDITKALPKEYFEAMYAADSKK